MDIPGKAYAILINVEQTKGTEGTLLWLIFFQKVNILPGGRRSPLEALGCKKFWEDPSTIDELSYIAPQTNGNFDSSPIQMIVQQELAKMMLGGQNPMQYLPYTR
ncbi:hypothetical protein M569_00178 [Genlisea aurea]|uniref:Uncharacterized protein n=1 Tax=Genlisea aurea TaxID=192259 RepID=S8D4B4_9LAMI|nr:hypothetical protein M569_00178 [Genlisea aurea]